MTKKPSILQLDHVVHENPRKARNKALQILEMLKRENRKTVLLPKGYSLEFENLKNRCRKKKQS